MSEPILYETHCHTPLCKHAVGEPAAYAAQALARGFKGIVFTCHCPLPDGVSAGVRMSPLDYERYHSMIAETREAFAGRLDVRVGLESDYYPGVEPWLENLHARHPLHHVLGSVHIQLEPLRKTFWTGSYFEYQQTYFEMLARSAETGLFDTLAHPDLVKILEPTEWRFERIRPSIEKALDRIAATGVAMELNTSGRHKPYPEMNPGREMLAMIGERGIPMVVGADAHQPERVGEGYREALETLREIGFTDTHVVLDRQRRAVAIDDALASLLPRN